MLSKYIMLKWQKKGCKLDQSYCHPSNTWLHTKLNNFFCWLPPILEEEIYQYVRQIMLVFINQVNTANICLGHQHYSGNVGLAFKVLMWMWITFENVAHIWYNFWLAGMLSNYHWLSLQIWVFWILLGQLWSL